MSEETGLTNDTERPTPAAPPRQRRGCLVSRLAAAFLVILITTFLTLSAVALAYVWMGFPVDAPQRLAESRALFATTQAESTAVRLENSLLQTQVIELGRRSATDREALEELQQQVAALDGLREQLAASDAHNATVVAEARDELAASDARNATVVTEMRAIRDEVAVFATAEAGRVAQLNDLQARSDRIVRFLQRLSDISGDAAFDLDVTPSVPAGQPGDGSDTPTPALVDTPTAEPTATLTRTPEPTATPEATATPRP